MWIPFQEEHPHLRLNYLKENLQDQEPQVKLSKLRLLATSREYNEIKRTMGFIARSISMDNPVVTEDIRRWVSSATMKDEYMSRWSAALLEKVRGALPIRAHGMYAILILFNPYYPSSLDFLPRIVRCSLSSS